MKLFTFNAISNECEKLIEEIRQQRDLINSLNNRLNQHTNADLIESEIYELRAAEVKYNYLLRQYKILAAIETDKHTVTQTDKQDKQTAKPNDKKTLKEKQAALQ